MKGLCKPFEVLRRSGKIQIGSEGERIFVLGGLRNKYLARCLILRSNYYLYTVLKKVFFSIRKDLFKSFEVLSRRGKNQTSSTQEGFFILGGLRKKYLARCQVLRSKYYLYTIQQKLFFNIVKDTFKSFEVLSRRGKIKISSEGERIFVLDGLRNKYLARCLILRSNYYLYTVLKKCFSV